MTDTTKSGWGADAIDHPTRNQRLTVREFIWADMDAYRSIWSFLGNMHDLVGEIVIGNVPSDDPATSIFLVLIFCIFSLKFPLMYGGLYHKMHSIDRSPDCCGPRLRAKAAGGASSM